MSAGRDRKATPPAAAGRVSSGRDRVGARVVRNAVSMPALGPAARNGRVRVSEMQRARLLGAAVAAVEELGWSHVTVASIASRARVSRKTFYDLFSDREDCLLAVLRDTTERVASELEHAGLEKLVWRERVRGGLWIILSFFDREPELARVCVVQSARGSRGVAQAREEIIARLTSLVDEGRLGSERAAQAPPLTAEGSVGAVLSILYRRLLNDEDGEPLGGLLGDLIGLIILPYLGAAAALKERKRPTPKTPVLTSAQTRVYHAGEDPLKDIPMRLTYRTARVLEATAQQGKRGIYPSNRLLGEHAGIHDQGQISKLLARLKDLGLLTNTAGRDAHTKGAANAWRLTPLGEQVTERLHLSTDTQQEDPA